MAPTTAAKNTKAAKKSKSSRPHRSNTQLVKGISKFSRSRAAKRIHFLKKKNGGKFPAAKKVEQKVHAKRKAPRWYPTDIARRPADRTKFRKWDGATKEWKYKKTTTHLRSSISAGTVLILLAGRHRGKRVVFLKQLPSGLLLVTGPYKYNGVPLRRVNQAYVIGTSTKVELPSVNLSKFNDAYFKKAKTAKKAEDAHFAEESAKKSELPAAKKEDQKTIDKVVRAAILKVPHLKDYVASRFQLSKGQYPHEMKF